MDISNLREQYKLSTLSKKDILDNPVEQFKLWIEQAIKSESPEPNAMTLATVDSIGQPSARIVLLKEITKEGFIFYTNYSSKKAQDMEVNENVAVVFNWLELQRQVRIKGSITKISREHSEKYFHSRPRKSQIGAVVSAQSSTIASRQVLENKLEQLHQEFEGKEKIPMPDDWGGYLISPRTIEFWQGRRSRLHDRLQYTHTNGRWKIQRLSP